MTNQRYRTKADFEAGQVLFAVMEFHTAVDIANNYSPEDCADEDLEILKILGMTDEEIMAEAIEEFGSEDAANEEANRIRSNIIQAIEKTATQK